MARHSAPHPPRFALRAGLTMAAVAAALGAGGTAAHAATATASGSPLDTVGAALNTWSRRTGHRRAQWWAVKV
ncbi:hypothetical protein SSCG_02459 [Streptomyces clavuligerus]|nr:hypothetical protein [Streptomyces clavuligerus]EDY49431.1 hypothetical protein SSCG_02459 [Streptomyces clavuligerus]